MDATRRQVLRYAALAGAASVIGPFSGHAATRRKRGWTIIEPGDEPEPSARVARFERMAFGMFVHWGLYSQYGKGEWVKHVYEIPTDQYMKKMDSFTAGDFSGRDLARLARRTGMKYVTLTSRHHDGFSLYDTRSLSPYDVTRTPAGRDLIADFTEGCRAEGIVPMLYCTTLDWTDERFRNDWKAYQQYLRDSVELLCTRYGPIGGFWFDGNWSNPEADWEQDALYAVIRRHQPDAMIINNTGIEAGGKVGHPEIDSVTFERGRPEPLDRSGMDKYVTGEMCHTMNFHWGIGLKDFNYLSPAHVIEELCLCRRAGANLLMNIGPTATGALPEYEAAAFRRVGDWIDLMGGDDGPIYAGRPGRIHGQDEDFGLIMPDGRIFVFVFGLTATANTQALGSAARGPGPRVFTGVNQPVRSARWLDTGDPPMVEQDGPRVTVHAMKYPYGVNSVVRVAELLG